MAPKSFLQGLGLALSLLGGLHAQAQTQPATAAAAAASTSAPSNTLARIQADGVVRMGVRDTAPPFAYYDAQGKPAGFSWKMCEAMVQQMSQALQRPLSIQPVPVSLAASFEMLADGRIDLQCGSTTHTVEREQKVDFSNSFFVSGIVVSYRKNDLRFAHPQQFGRVGVLASSTAATIMNKRVANKGNAVIDAVIPLKSYEEGVSKLKSKEIDTLFADSVLVPTDAEISRRRSLETVEPYALMVRKGDKAFLQQVDAALAKVLASPSIRQFAVEAKMDDKLNALTTEVWRRPSRDPAPQLH